MKNLLPAVCNRVSSDFLKGSRLDAYRSWIEAVLEAGYQVCPVGVAWQLIGMRRVDPDSRLLVLHHDVDNEPVTAAAMWDIERKLGIRSSYFFRLAIQGGDPVMSVLVHPRHWHADPMPTTRHDIWRAVEGLRFEFVPRPRARA